MRPSAQPHPVIARNPQMTKQSNSIATILGLVAYALLAMTIDRYVCARVYLIIYHCGKSPEPPAEREVSTLGPCPAGHENFPLFFTIKPFSSYKFL